MGFSSEYNLCRPHINQLNLHWVNGRDWSQSYTSEPPPTDDDETPSETWSITRDKSTGLAVFETGIRYLGGLLGAYDFSGDTLLLDRAKELGDILSKAFNTESGLPSGRIDPGDEGGIYRLGSVSIAEVGSMSLELIRLSQVTGDRKYQDLAQRAMDYLEKRVIPRAPAQSKPLIPMWFQPDAPLDQLMPGGITLGGLSDSYYEYLIKTYKLLGGGPSSEQWKRIYIQSVEAFRKNLYVDITVVPGRDLLALGKSENGHLIHEIEHLTCFAGAMLGLGAQLLNRPSDQVDAEKFTETCYWLSAATPLGLQPEVVEFFEPDVPEGLRMDRYTKDGKLIHPILRDELGLATSGQAYKDGEGVWMWHDGEVIEFGKPKRKAEGEVEVLKGVPVGTKKVNGRGINRPETIESIFYMYVYLHFFLLQFFTLTQGFSSGIGTDGCLGID
jgi:mannosyl-oligosaccharide alpha-1,2-mannosidase